MTCLIGLNDWTQVVEPVESRFSFLEASEDRIDAVRSFSDGFCVLRSDELCGVFSWQFISVFILLEGKIFLDIVSEDEYIRVFSSDG